MLLPEWIEFAEAESTATSLIRGLRGLTGQWGELIATAQAIVSHYQEIAPHTSETLYEEPGCIPLIAASHILDSASLIQSGLPAEDRNLLALSAATAFGMWGNFASACAVVKRAFYPSKLPDEFASIIAINAPTLLPQVLAGAAISKSARALLDEFSYFLSTGNLAEAELLAELLAMCIKDAPDSLSASLLRSSRISLSHVLRLSVARVLRQECPDLPSDYHNNLQGAGMVVFLPPQYKAVVGRKLVMRPENAVIAMPTSTGKTFLAELCIVNALSESPGLACYIAPWIALGKQITDRFKERLPTSFVVHSLLGGYADAERVFADQRREVVVATPERFDLLLRASPEILENLRCVVVDEAHMVQNDERGARTEGLLTRLRLLQAQGYRFRIVLVSAVLPYEQLGALGQWLAAPSDCMFVDKWRPTARRLACWRQEGRIVWFAGNDMVRRDSTEPDAALGEIPLPWPEPNLYPHHEIGILLHELPSAARNVAYICDHLHSEYDQPILCVCGTRYGTRLLAGELANRFSILEPVPPQINRVIGLISRQYPYLKSLASYLQRGVAFHNSSLPAAVREGVERAAADRELRVVCSTTTLAEGVDLPFRFTILVDWMALGADEPMSSLLFRNISGRCGRAGQYTEGDTVLFDNPSGPPHFAAEYVRHSLQKELMFGEGTSISPSALKNVTPDRTHAAARSERIQAALASQFLAAIPENSNEDDLVHAFSKNTLYAHTSGATSVVQSALTRVRESLLNDLHFAVSASPLRLTALGETANLTGFSPGSCGTILTTLQAADIAPEIKSACTGLLRKLSGLPEQTHPALTEVTAGKKKKFIIKDTDLEALFDQWMQGAELVDMFRLLPAVLRSKRGDKLDDWLAGRLRNSSWDRDFDKFSDFILAAFEGFLPWVLRACRMLSRFTDSSAAALPWDQWVAVVQSRRARADDFADRAEQ